MESYRVPFLFDRSGAPFYRLVNIGPERLRGVTVSLTGDGQIAATFPTVLEATEELRLTVLGDELQQDSSLIVRWLRPSGEDYLWRVVF